MAKMIHLESDERIIAVVPEHASGPGWSNSVVWVHIVNSSNMYRCEALQPDEQSSGLRDLFVIGETVHRSLLSKVLVIRARRPYSTKKVKDA